MILQAGDLGILIDFGENLPGSVLQLKESGEWRDYVIDGKPVTAPVDIEGLPSGEYRIRNVANLTLGAVLKNQSSS